MGSTFGYDSQSALPDGFVGCTESVCEMACMSVAMSNSTAEMEIVTGSDSSKTWGFQPKDTNDGMFMMKDLAEMSAISRGCSGSHAMNGMYMHGSGHEACMSSYDDHGVVFGDDPESGSSLILLNLSVVSTLAIVIISLVV